MTSLPWVEDDGGRAAAGYTGQTGDCVARALAIASGLPYQDVYAALHTMARNTRLIRNRRSPREGVAPQVYKQWLEAVGAVWTPTMRIGSGCTHHLVDGEVPDRGRLVVRLSRHLAAVIDGVVHDTYDPAREGTRCVYGWWEIPHRTWQADGEAACETCGVGMQRVGGPDRGWQRAVRVFNIEHPSDVAR